VWLIVGLKAYYVMYSTVEHVAMFYVAALLGNHDIHCTMMYGDAFVIISIYLHQLRAAVTNVCLWS
jgi:hypothetical protein